ncbi:MAG TPA: hypothetical protein VJ824_06110 [Bacillota bacterium]|nr:hypothetical protein [Bacillota bacterium]
MIFKATLFLSQNEQGKVAITLLLKFAVKNIFKRLKTIMNFKDALTILRTFSNFCETYKSADGKELTPAHRLWITDKVFDLIT